MIPLSESDIPEFDVWLASRPYPEWRKIELKEVHNRMASLTLNERYAIVKCFMKHENYTEYKHGRGIFSRSDFFKCLFGPLCSAVEERLYQHPAFIKKIPVADRPKYLEELFSFFSSEIGETDYTSFESSFSENVMKVTDKNLFDYMFSVINSKWYRKIYTRPMGMNRCVFKWFVLLILSKRMSGEMSTSLLNGFANLMTMSFIAWEKGARHFAMAVEGDDGLTKGDFIRLITELDFSSLGFKVKLKKTSDISEASFCGIVYHPDDCINVTDPREVLANFGWASKHYANRNKKTLSKLLRCKALSYLHQYPGCPVIQELALYGLRATKSYDVRHFIEADRSMSLWEREQLRAAVNVERIRRPVGISTRLLVERLYGLSVEEQLRIELALSLKDVLEPIHLTLTVPQVWVDYFNKYSYDASLGEYYVSFDPVRYMNLVFS